MASLRFSKYEGLGNDFLVVESAEPSCLDDRVPALCDRRRGVGADGVLLVLPPFTPGSAGRMRVVNADGSSPEMCGNGLRCVALHLRRTRPDLGAEFVVDTDAGPKACATTWTPARPGDAEVLVDMGRVAILEETTVDALGRAFSLVLADAGNPHAVHLGALPRDEVAIFGPALATHPRFPKGTNVEFVDLAAAARASVVVWERGVGLTLACGTGACAVAAVLAARGLAPHDQELTIELSGGPLHVRVARDGRVTMRGPARLTFEGDVP
ncbi:MAG: diaminopimelate epimerase [Myxococcales bacterium]|nr:diaminopimelate epimerase [Myxococcales bacterium]MBL0195692.1 diaminopimelate epimerase [Myxococcales bacterium]HQY63085.1 diaminopimelate epimerase [Polyangiaceae bacterium]